MATNAIIYDVAVINASKTKETLKPNKIDNKTAEPECKTTITAHRLVKFICSCVCHITPSDSPSYQSTKRKFQPLPATTLDNETLDFNYSYTSCECLCSQCPKEYYKFPNIDSFSNLNISSSTAFENTSLVDFNITDTTTEDFKTPPKEYNGNNCRGLGILQEKRSPLFGPTYNTPSKGLSLRSQKPFYSQQILQRDEFLSSENSPKTQIENIDYTATEAISMNGGKHLSNGPLVGTSLRSGSTSGAGNLATDINRNNGVPKNWVSFDKL